MFAIEEALREAGYDCALWANHSHIEIMPDRYGKVFSAPPIRMEALASCQYPLASCADFFAAIGFDSIELVEMFFRSIGFAIECYKPNVIITDFCAIGSIAAQVYQVPFISTLRWTYHTSHPENHKNNHPNAQASLNTFNELLSRQGLESTNNVAELIYRGAAQCIVPSIPLLEPGLVNFDHLKWLGPLVSSRLELRGGPESWQCACSDHRKKRAYVYIDPCVLSIADQYQLLCESFKGSNWSVMLSTPKGYHGCIDQTKNGVEFIVQPAGQTMIEFADVYLTHCGSNSTQLSILSLTPVIAIPGDSQERRTNATVLERLGLAVILEEANLSSERILYESENALRANPTDEAKHWREFIQCCRGVSEIPEIIARMKG